MVQTPNTTQESEGGPGIEEDWQHSHQKRAIDNGVKLFTIVYCVEYKQLLYVTCYNVIIREHWILMVNGLITAVALKCSLDPQTINKWTSLCSIIVFLLFYYSFVLFKSKIQNINRFSFNIISQ